MNVFLTGATGYIGGAIADALQRTGHTVLGLAHSEQSARGLQARSITPLRGDLRDPCAGYLAYPFQIRELMRTVLVLFLCYQSMR